MFIIKLCRDHHSHLSVGCRQTSNANGGCWWQTCTLQLCDGRVQESVCKVWNTGLLQRLDSKLFESCARCLNQFCCVRVHEEVSGTVQFGCRRGVVRESRNVPLHLFVRFSFSPPFSFVIGRRNKTTNSEITAQRTMCLTSCSIGLTRKKGRRDYGWQWPPDPFQVLHYIGNLILFIEVPVLTAPVVHLYAIGPIWFVSCFLTSQRSC